MKKSALVFISLLLVVIHLSSQNIEGNRHSSKVDDAKMKWWKEAKYGLFIHWGVYAVPAGKWGDETWYAEWIMKSAKISRADYAKLAEKFNPTKFNAEEWVKMAKDAGQKYIVFTSKHHDGMAMFKSKDPYNVVDATPFKRDVVKELADACRKYDIKLGLYYSQAQDWYHPGGAVWENIEWDSSHIGSMNKYIDEIALPQVKEILSNYGDIAVLWWDTPVGMTKEMAQKLDTLVKQYPNLITNDRLGGGFGGDLETPEQFIPATGFPGRNWEACMTLNGDWGYNAWNDRWKSTKDVVRMLVDIASKGGNLLLNVGPNAYGVIPEVCQNTLRETGNWLKTNGEAIYGAQASPFPYLYWGRATRKGQKLYLQVFDWPKDGKLVVPLSNVLKNPLLLGSPKTKLSVQKTGYRNVIYLPDYAPDKNASVIAIDVVGEIQVNASPSDGKSVVVIGKNKQSATELLTDNKLTTIWTAEKDENKVVLEMDLGHEESISASGLLEKGRIHGLANHFKQVYELHYWNGKEWVKLVDGWTNGGGIVKTFERIKARKFRLQLEVENGLPSLVEWVLYRGE